MVRKCTIIRNKSRRIESTEVKRSSWLELRRIETEWDQCYVIGGTVTGRCMVINWGMDTIFILENKNLGLWYIGKIKMKLGHDC